MLCTVCHKETPVLHGAGRPRKYCSTACRQRAYRQRHEHVGTPRLPPATRPISGDPGQVIAVLLLPAALAGCVGQDREIGRVLEWGLLHAAPIRSGPAAGAATPKSPEERESASTPGEGSDPEF